MVPKPLVVNTNVLTKMLAKWLLYEMNYYRVLFSISKKNWFFLQLVLTHSHIWDLVKHEWIKKKKSKSKYV
jgi:hypothetical protein